MNTRGLYRLTLLIAAGGMVFQTTASCDSQGLNMIAATLVPTLTSTLESAIAAATQCDTISDTSGGSVTAPSGNVFDSVNDAIQGVRSGLDAGTIATSADDSSS